MKLSDFKIAVDGNPDMYFGVDIGEDGVVIVNHRPTKTATTIPVKSIVELEWEEIEGVITGKREPQQISHMTRVVGYYSRIDNWNKSKQEENKARHNGNYAVPE